MKARAETISLASETSLKTTDRSRLLAELFDYAQYFHAQAVFLSDIERRIMKTYIPALTLTGTLKAQETLGPMKQAHLRKMLAIEAKDFLPVRQVGVGRLDEFREVIEGLVGPEIGELESFGTLDILSREAPTPWRNAHRDLLKLQEASQMGQ